MNNNEGSLNADIQEVLNDFKFVFEVPKELPPQRSHDHSIHLLPNTPPINIIPYRHPPNQKDAVELMVKELIDFGVTRKSKSSFSSPIVMVKKNDGNWRMCVSYMKLNKYIVKDNFHIPVTEELLDKLNGAKVDGQLRRKGRLVVGNDESLKQQIMPYFHKGPLEGHSGVHVTAKKLADVFFWKGLKKMVKSFVKERDVMVEAVDRFLQAREQVIHILQFHLKRAHDRMVNMENKRRSERVFKIGDWVYVKFQPHRQVSMRQEVHHKLFAKYFRPFQVIGKIGEVAYKLQLPTTSLVHPIFRVSQLNKFHGQTVVEGVLPRCEDDGILLGMKKCENAKCELQTKIVGLENVLTQQTKYFDDVKLELSNRTTKFEAYFKKLKNTKVVLERQLARKVDDSKAEKD
ncbi:reverse transcriptase [Tanacetum coccineum]